MSTFRRAVTELRAFEVVSVHSTVFLRVRRFFDGFSSSERKPSFSLDLWSFRLCMWYRNVDRAEPVALALELRDFDKRVKSYGRFSRFRSLDFPTDFSADQFVEFSEIF